MNNKAVFLDRDGVIIHNRARYVRSWNDVIFYPYSLKAIKLLSNSEYKIFIITNQSVVGRGLLTVRESEQINNQILRKITDSGGRIDQIYTCIHAPQENCNCRKPLPGLILNAQDDHDLDLSKSWLIGDALSDLLAGVNSGIENLILVSTGRGNKQATKFSKEISKINPFLEKNIYTSVKRILQVHR